MGFLSDLFAKLFGGGSPKSGESKTDALREYIDRALPESYVQSRKYALSIKDRKSVV